MAGFTAQGATLTWSGTPAFTGSVTGISVETPTAVVADMTAVGDQAGYMVMVPTGDWVGGTIAVDFISFGDPQGIVRQTGVLTLTTAAQAGSAQAGSAQSFSVSRRALCQSASISAQVGEIVRGSLKFLMTDYK